MNLVGCYIFCCSESFWDSDENYKTFPKRKKNRIYECVRKIFQKYHRFRGLRKSSQSQSTSERSDKGDAYKSFHCQHSSASCPGQNFVAKTSLLSFPFFSNLCFLTTVANLPESEVLHFPFGISCSKRTQMKKGPREKTDLKWWVSILAAGMGVGSAWGRCAWHFRWVLCFVK